jgi:mannose-6-phosphate isomerase-like protein (cupin superfamily)
MLQMAGSGNSSWEASVLVSGCSSRRRNEAAATRRQCLNRRVPAEIRMERPNMADVRPIVLREHDAARELWNDGAKGVLSFRTLFSAGTTETGSLTVGVADLEPGDWLGLHCHTPAEVYYVVDGEGIVSLDGVEHSVSAGTAVFIPGNTEHGIRNPGSAPLRFFYAFAVDSFDDIEYRFAQ